MKDIVLEVKSSKCERTAIEISGIHSDGTMRRTVFELQGNCNTAVLHGMSKAVDLINLMEESK